MAGPRRALKAGLLAGLVAVGAAVASAHPLEPIQVLEEGGGGLGAIWGASALVLSPDGLHAYVTGAKSNSVAAVNVADLAWIDVERDGVAGVDGLADASDVAVSPDGAHVYVASREAVVVFARNAATGALDFVESLPFEKPVARNAPALAVSPDGAHVYVAAGFVSRFARNAATGALTLLGKSPAPFPAVSIAVSPDGAHVYLGLQYTNQSDPEPDARLAVFSRDAATGALTQASYYTGPLHDLEQCPPAGPCADFYFRQNYVRDIAFSPGGEQVYLAVAGSVDGYSESLSFGAVTVLARDAETGVLSLIEYEETPPIGQDPVPVPNLRGAAAVAVSADGANVYVASAVSDAVAAFSRDPETGALTSIGAQVDRAGGVRGLNGPVGIAVSPGGARVFVASAQDDALVAFDREPATGGALAFANLVDDGGARGLFGGLSVGTSPDGRFVYVSGAEFKRSESTPSDETDVPPSSIGILARDPTTGLLSPAGEYESLPAAATRLSPTLHHLYALVGNDILCFSRDPQTGAIAPIQTLADAARDMLAISDGEHLYVAPASAQDGTIVHYRRDAPAPDLAPVGVYGEEVYVGSSAGLATGPSEGRINAFGYDTGTPVIVALDRETDGSLQYRFVNTFDPETGEGGGLNMSAGSRYLYATFRRGFLVHARGKDDLGGFRWSTGRSYLADDAASIPRFRRVAALPNESTVYFAFGYHYNFISSYDAPGRIHVFARVPGSEALVFEEDEAAARLRDENSFAISTDGHQLYAASGYDDSMVVFATPEPDAAVASLAALAALSYLARGVRRQHPG